MTPEQPQPIRKKLGKFKKLLFIAILVVGGLFVAEQGFTRLPASLFGGRVLNTVSTTHFDTHMPTPPLAASTVTADGTRVFDLTLQTGKTAFYSGTPTDTWGVNGSYLGPTLRAAQGEKVQVHVKNTLPEATSIHWHGMHLPAVMDGGPHQPIAPNSTWSPTWTINQPAATLWYHPHPHGETETHTYKGIAGMFIIDDPAQTPADLPHTYGVDDLPVIVQDKKFDADHQMIGGKGDDDGPTGILGDTILVNGARTPYVEATTRLVRLRLLNASTARIYNFGFSDNRHMQLIASDSGLLEHPVDTSRVQLSPGERAEVVVEVTPGETVNLQSFPYDFHGPTPLINAARVGANDTLSILQIKAASTLAPSATLPSQLAAIPRLKESDAVKTRTFELSSDNGINSKSMDMNRIDFSVTQDTTEIWEIHNEDAMPHSFHIHDVHFQIASINGSAPPAALAGWKDTILIMPDQTERLIMKFSDYSDPSHPYMYHCHFLLHEDNGMMGQFVVVKPGQTANVPHDMSHMQ